MKKRTILRKFIENFPVENFRDNPLKDVNLKELSWNQLITLSELPHNFGHVLSIKDGHLYYAEVEHFIRRCGNKFFKQSNITNYVYISPKEINIHCRTDLICSLLKLANINWIKDVNFGIWHLLNKSILKSVLINSIYNQETFYKAIAKRVHHVDVSWKTMRAYTADQGYSISVADLRCFTVNVENSIKRWVEADFGLKQLLKDLLRSAVKLNQKVDFNWSIKRIEQEHTKQTNLLMQKELSKKDKTDIYINKLSYNPNIKLLNTELDIFLEGTNMHHCVYTNYYKNIRDHDYIVLHMTYPEDCTIGIGLDQNYKPFLQQIYLKYDKAVQPETRKIAEKYISDNSENLFDMFNQDCSKVSAIKERVRTELIEDLF